MTKPSPILICPMVPLRQLPDNERDIIRRFLFDHVRGIGAKNDEAWHRLWNRITKADPGEGFQFFVLEERSGPFHRRHRVILEALFASQERFRLIDKLHDWLKVGAGFVTWAPGLDHKPVAIPRSTNFEDCSEQEMRRFHKDAIDYLHTERAQRFLWKKVKASQRPEMLEAVLNRPEES